MTTSIKELENGDLEFSISDYSFSEFREAVEIGKKSYGKVALWDLFERDFCNSSYSILPDYAIEELGALTSAPMISDYDFWYVSESDSEEAIKERDEYMETIKIWWYPEYETKNLYEVLLRKKKVIFQNVNND